MVGVPKASLVGGLAFLVSPLTRKALTFLRMRRASANPAALAARFASTPRFRQVLLTNLYGGPVRP
jgi:hypothetical protein